MTDQTKLITDVEDLIASLGEECTCGEPNHTKHCALVLTFYLRKMLASVKSRPTMNQSLFASLQLLEGTTSLATMALRKDGHVYYAYRLDQAMDMWRTHRKEFSNVPDQPAKNTKRSSRVR